MTFTVRIDGIDKVRAQLGAAEKQVNFAAMQAINDTAKVVVRDARARFVEIFDRPTRYTVTSFRVRKYATRSDLTAEVGFSDYLRSKRFAQGDAGHKLYHQFRGGARSRKGIEMHLQAKGLLARGEYLVVGDGARLDAHGNISPGQIAQIMSQLKLGDRSSWSSGSSRSRRNAVRAGRYFWSAGEARSAHLARGIWLATAAGAVPILIVVAAVQYQRRMDLDALGASVVTREFNRLFAAHYEKALATAR